MGHYVYLARGYILGQTDISVNIRISRLRIEAAVRDVVSKDSGLVWIKTFPQTKVSRDAGVLAKAPDRDYVAKVVAHKKTKYNVPYLHIAMNYKEMALLAKAAKRRDITWIELNINVDTVKKERLVGQTLAAPKKEEFCYNRACYACGNQECTQRVCEEK